MMSQAKTSCLPITGMFFNYPTSYKELFNELQGVILPATRSCLTSYKKLSPQLQGVILPITRSYFMSYKELSY